MYVFVWVSIWESCLPAYLSIHPSIYLSNSLTACPSLIYPSICLPAYLSICSPAHLTIYPSIDPSIHLSIYLHLFIYLPVNLSNLSVFLSSCLSFCPSTYLPTHLSSVHLSICPPIYPSICPPFYLSFFLSSIFYLPIHPSILQTWRQGYSCSCFSTCPRPAGLQASNRFSYLCLSSYHRSAGTKDVHHSMRLRH